MARGFGTRFLEMQVSCMVAPSLQRGSPFSELLGLCLWPPPGRGQFLANSYHRPPKQAAWCSWSPSRREGEGQSPEAESHRRQQRLDARPSAALSAPQWRRKESGPLKRWGAVSALTGEVTVLVIIWVGFLRAVLKEKRSATSALPGPLP